MRSRCTVTVIRTDRESLCRSPKLTELSRRIVVVWFLLQWGEFHHGRQAVVSALPSTGVLPLRRTAGALRSSDGRVQIAVHDLAAVLAVLAVFAADRAVSQAQIVVHPPTRRAGLRRWLPPTGDERLTALMAWARWWCLSMPDTCESSITTTDVVFASREVK